MPRNCRIVVTGLGAIAAVGSNASDVWNALVQGRSGVDAITTVGPDARPAYVGAVKDIPTERAGLPRKKLKMMGRQAQLAYVAAHEAATDAGVESGRTVQADRFGIILGVGMLNADVAELGLTFTAIPHGNGAGCLDMSEFGRSASSRMFPLWLLRHIPNLAVAYAAIALDAQAASNTIATGCVAAANAIGEAARIIERGEADVMIAGGADARVSPLALARYRDLGWMTTREGCLPSEVSRPFDAEASGLVSAEGAGVVVLESLDHAERRGARIRAEFVGYAAANDACTVMHPHVFGRGLGQAVARCLDRSGTRASDVDAVLAPATSLPEHDRATARSLEQLFGKSRRTMFAATRSMLGHAHAASAGLDCVAAVRAVETSQLPPAINVTRPITDLPLASASMPVDVRTAVVGAYGFGGHGAALAWRRYTS